MRSTAGATDKWCSCIRSARRAPIVLLLMLHAGLVAWIDARNSPNPDETAHLAAGIVIWRSDRFDLYPVNPPLVRAIAALPMVYGCPEGNWKFLDDQRRDASRASRHEWSLGIQLVRNNPDRTIWFFTLARWACIPLSLIGGYFCWRWASELYGTWAAALTLALWCFSPNVMAWSATICPDVAAASLGIAACYFFWRWLREPEWYLALLAGTALGLAELAKMTWLLLFVVWPILWVAWRWGRGNLIRPLWARQLAQLASILALGLFVLNLGYSFSGTFTRLGDFRFVSRTLAGKASIIDGGDGGNCLAGSWLHCVPVPLPRDYVEGVDLQKLDFERGLPSYLFGQWSERGWWYYYIVCAVFKVPLGIWALGILAVGVRVGRLVRIAESQPQARQGENRPCWLDEVVLLVPAIALITFVSSQTGFGRHFRYVLPAFPFLFVWIGSVAQAALRRPWTMGLLVVGALTWMVVSSLSVYPYSMSYFNELAGGPMGGPRYLLDSNVDWGQDVLYLKEWCEKHPEATPLYVAFSNSYSDVLLGLGDRVKKLDCLAVTSHEQALEKGNRDPPSLGPKPGWYAVSVHRIHDANDHYQYFRQFTPVATAGYSVYVYHVTREEANRARRALGLRDLSSDEVAEW